MYVCMYVCLYVFKKVRVQVLKRHHDSFHSNRDRFSDRKKLKFKIIFLEKLKNWLSAMETNEKTSDDTHTNTRLAITTLQQDY